MNKETIELLINDGKSINEIAKQFDKSQTSIRYWMRKYGLKSKWNGFLQIKYSDNELLTAANSSFSFTECLDKLSINTSGGAFYHFKRRLKLLGFDFSKFTNTGGRVTAFKRNKDALKNNSKKRIKRGILETLLKHNNVKYECNMCGINNWKNKRLLLHIHHKDENSKNNTLNNLCYLCPNCHNITHYDDQGKWRTN